ncbi:MAG TPA: electron-transfer flavoprotein:ubiquinone oxidoreductase [Anaerohalosphaeraceae bacterium]|nr:4Fe-4S dicluster domain-containing protein [Phycisphaerae bacterium]HOL31726.1 electron-transfer flavoprotein:ubiquinone oxidoreductase [Anaerohalosphaeraceae bacterium]HPO69362.1 electron-transfer flavoprotein:ubiquinone oxidoreductase [Anaerohalosphaeraceae bacterium]
MQDYTNVSVLVVGAGPAGLSAAITLKKLLPALDVVVIDKAAGPGNHNLSGAVLESRALGRLLDTAVPNWSDSEEAKAVLLSKVDRDDVMFLLGSKMAFRIEAAIKLAKALKLAFGQMSHKGDYICSVSKLTTWLCKIAAAMGVEILHGFAAEDIIWDTEQHLALGVKLKDQGLDKHGQKQPNYLPGEVIRAKSILIAEGCDGLLAEKFISKAGLVRQANQLYSLGVKELIRVSDSQYARFGSGRVVHAMGYPIWTPLIGPAMFGGGIMYPMGGNHIAVGMIVGLDYKYCDFNPQDALTLFKSHSFVRPFIEGGTITEAGVKMIPEGGLYAIPRCPDTQSIGRSNVLLLGDSAGFVNMCKIKGLHNAIESGIAAAAAIAEGLDRPKGLARIYTKQIEEAGVIAEMETAKNFRQTVAKFGPLQGMPLSILGSWLPKFNIEPDYTTMTRATYRLKPAINYDKDTFTAVAATVHREEQPCHLLIQDETICRNECLGKYGAPCITFCPAGVYESIHGQPKPANPSNCLHCKTCQRKCPFDNIRWTVPEPSGGPKYKTM